MEGCTQDELVHSARAVLREKERLEEIKETELTASKYMKKAETEHAKNKLAADLSNEIKTVAAKLEADKLGAIPPGLIVALDKLGDNITAHALLSTLGDYSLATGIGTEKLLKDVLGSSQYHIVMDSKKEVKKS